MAIKTSLVRAFIKVRLIRKLLMEQNVSQKELAHRVGISKQHMSNIINGKSMSPSVRKRLLAALRECGMRVSFHDVFRIEE